MSFIFNAFINGNLNNCLNLQALGIIRVSERPFEVEYKGGKEVRKDGEAR